ncbi:GtrA family protein [Variovorax sp. ZS18.2.2]|uniref:GtrA family protein n=1 Tax=Variovorax sp. ZS18.2.2 TaxID=2971255 RepID=UPI0021512C5F|nr:GtrA family protein [Variovorax sp. ZS18.2.2]MCR6477832.1 GtrA family protein [Variovorax sp. ZS18.2.2]
MRQLILFGVVGVTQLLADTLIFYLLLELSITPWIANSLSRFLALLLGFVLNGAITFRQPDNTASTSKKSFVRLLILWLALTLVSSELVTLASHHVSGPHLLLAKLGVELVLAFVSFFISKTWVYR